MKRMASSRHARAKRFEESTPNIRSWLNWCVVVGRHQIYEKSVVLCWVVCEGVKVPRGGGE
jgi:hypothetical protein